MLLIGLTGSIATGKSTASALISSPTSTSPHNHSLPLIDADLLARQVVEPGARAYRQIVAYFGPTTPDLLQDDPDGKFKKHGAPLNRPALGRRVFGDTEERVRDRKVLNGIVHPAVRFAMFRAMLYYYLRGHWAVVLDVPLLFESRLDIFCGTVIVIAVSDPHIQMARLRARDPHLTEEDAKNRVSSQVDVRVKAEKALGRNKKEGEGRGYVIYNDGDKAELEAEVARVMADIRRKSPRWWSWLMLVCPPLMTTVAGWEMVRAWMTRNTWERERDGGGGDGEMAKPKL